MADVRDLHRRLNFIHEYRFNDFNFFNDFGFGMLLLGLGKGNEKRQYRRPRHSFEAGTSLESSAIPRRLRDLVKWMSRMNFQSALGLRAYCTR